MSAVSSPGTPRKADKTYDGSVDFLFILVLPVLIITSSTQTHYKFYLSAFSSAAAGEVRGSTRLRWPTSSDLNTRLRRIIAGYQRVVKKQELKKAAAEKVCEYSFKEVNVPRSLISGGKMSVCLRSHSLV